MTLIRDASAGSGINGNACGSTKSVRVVLIDSDEDAFLKRVKAKMKKLIAFMMLFSLAIGTVGLTGCGGEAKKKDETKKTETK